MNGSVLEDIIQTVANFQQIHNTHTHTPGLQKIKCLSSPEFVYVFFIYCIIDLEVCSESLQSNYQYISVYYHSSSRYSSGSSKWKVSPQVNPPDRLQWPLMARQIHQSPER